MIQLLCLVDDALIFAIELYAAGVVSRYFNLMKKISNETKDNLFEKRVHVMKSIDRAIGKRLPYSDLHRNLLAINTQISDTQKKAGFESQL